MNNLVRLLDYIMDDAPAWKVITVLILLASLIIGLFSLGEWLL